MSKKKKPDGHHGWNAIVKTEPPPPGARCGQCITTPTPATMVMTMFNTKSWQESRYLLCDGHAESFVYREYGPYMQKVKRA